MLVLKMRYLLHLRFAAIKISLKPRLAWTKYLEQMIQSDNKEYDSKKQWTMCVASYQYLEED